MLCNKELPEKEQDFQQLFHTLFPSMFDVKYLVQSKDSSHSYGLDYLGETLKLRRFGTAHQAGSDSLLTGHCYFRLLRENFNNNVPTQCNGILYGLSEDAASLTTPSSAAANVPGGGGGVNNTGSNFSSPMMDNYPNSPGGSIFPATPMNNSLRK